MRKFMVKELNNQYSEVETYYNEQELAELISENMSEEDYDNMLDDCYPEVEIMGMSYSPSVALYRLDEIAYNCGFNDYKDSQISDIRYELERLDNGETYENYGYEVTCIDNE